MAGIGVEITFRYSWAALSPILFGGFEIEFGGEKVGHMRKFFLPFREPFFASPGDYEMVLAGHYGVFKREVSGSFLIRIPNVDRCRVDLALGGMFGKYFWLIPVLKVVE